LEYATIVKRCFHLLVLSINQSINQTNHLQKEPVVYKIKPKLKPKVIDFTVPPRRGFASVMNV